MAIARHHGRLTFESEYQTKLGRRLPIEITFTYGSYCSRELIYAFAKDRTVEVDLREALEQERQCSQLRIEFIYSVLSHEIRTSLNLVSFSTSLLRRYNKQWSEKKKDLVSTAFSQ